MVYKQARRTVKIGTTLGEDAVQLVWFSGREEISRLFQFQLRLISMNPAIDATEMVSQNLTFSVEFNDGSSRYFNGFVRRMSAGDEDFKGRRGYSLEVVPWLWFLTKTSDCRIFQEKTVVEIIEEVFRNRGFSDFETSGIQGNHPKREYCVQYRETDFDFVSRLMEEEGILYYFRHENGKHVMVMGDSNAVYKDCAESVVDFPEDEGASHSVTPHILSWEHAWQFETGAWAHTDYNFKTPKQNLISTEKTLMKFQKVGDFEQFDYPGRYPDKGIGKPLARVRMEELESGHDMVQATSGCQSFSPGGRFTIGKHRVGAENGKSYVIRSIQHEGRESGYDSGDEAGFDYRNQFECFPDSVTFRPARETPKAIMRGCQTAVVTGPAGEEIHTNEHGQVKVKFHWDRKGPSDDKSSCWVRVSQPHAGAKWGYIDLPRVGEEVIVDFLEGDPDQPIIVGRVYNGQNKVPFDLPAEKTRRGNSTKTYKGSGYNEMSMDDTKGKEQIRIHGQYNMDTVIEHDETHTVHNNRTRQVDVNEQVTIGNNQSNAIGVNRTETVGANETITIGANRTETVGANETITIGAMKTETIGAAKALTIGAAYAVTVGAAMATTVGGAMTTTVGGNSSESVGAKKTVTVSDELSIVVGDSKLVMKKDGTILLQGKDILVKGSGKITVKASGDMVLKGSKIGEN